jgi:hypothetical protein
VLAVGVWRAASRSFKLCRMTVVPEDVRAFAVKPFRGVPLPPDMQQIEAGGAVLTLNRGNGAQWVHIEAERFDVGETVAAIREVAGRHGKATLAWWITSADAWAIPGLEAAGLANRDGPGYEAVLHALALVTEPAGQAPDDVAVEVVSTWEQYSKSYDVFAEVFGTPPVADDVRRARWKSYGLRGCRVIASLERQIVGAAAADYGPTALGLMAGAVLPEARGRGVYTAMVHARWRVAVERRTPALTITAGRMSRPICERMGFQYLEPISIFVDELALDVDARAER